MWRPKFEKKKSSTRFTVYPEYAYPLCMIIYLFSGHLFALRRLIMIHPGRLCGASALLSVSRNRGQAWAEVRAAASLAAWRDTSRPLALLAEHFLPPIPVNHLFHAPASSWLSPSLSSRPSALLVGNILRHHQCHNHNQIMVYDWTIPMKK